MAYYNAEDKLYSAIGCFSTIGQLISDSSNFCDFIDYASVSYSAGVFPGQCQAFLTTSVEFVWFIEEREVIYANPESPVGTPLVSFGLKKAYPAKVTGLNLSLLGNSYYNTTSLVTVRWRDELIRYGSNVAYYDLECGNFRPGFGELILSDLDRPLKNAVIETNNLGLPNLTYASNSARDNGFTGPLGRLMSIASYVNPELAAKYEKSQKKKKSLNEQTYQDPPEYPPYIPHEDNSGYGY